MDATKAVTSEGFAELLTSQLESEISIYPARAWYPSGLDHPCSRYMVWRFTRWERQTPHQATLQAIFDHGRDHQPLIYRRLEQLGFEVVRESDRPRQWQPRKGVKISGRPDGRIVSFRGEKYRPPYVLEAKSMSGYSWDAIDTVDDIRHAKAHYTRSYYAQGQIYALLEDVPWGVFALMSKATGMLKLIPYELEYAYAEGLLKRIEDLQPLIEQGVDPDPIPFDRAVCGGCGFLSQCYPPRDFGEGAAVLDDLELLAALEEREQAKPAHSSYDRADKTVKAWLKRHNVRQAVAGPFTIEASERHVKGFTVKDRTDVVYDIARIGAAVTTEEA